MTTAGWIFMISSITFVVLLVSFCYVRVLRKPSVANHLSSPLEAPMLDEND